QSYSHHTYTHSFPTRRSSDLFEIRGTDELSKALKELGKLDGVRNVVKKHGAQMQSSSQRFAPVDTGFLKQNIKLYIEDGGLTAQDRKSTRLNSSHVSISYAVF